MLLIELGKVMVLRLSQFKKAKSLIASGAAPSANAISLIPVLLKPPMVFMVVGKVTFFNNKHPSNELLLKLITPSFKITSVSPLFLNAPGLIFCTPPGMVTLPNEEQPLKA